MDINQLTKYIYSFHLMKSMKSIDFFSYSKKDCGSNDISLHFVEFSNVNNTDRGSNLNQSSLLYENV